MVTGAVDLTAAARHFHYLGETTGIIDSEIGKHFAIQLDSGLVQAVHESAIRQAVHSGSRINSRDPQRTELPLTNAPVTVSILKRSFYIQTGCAQGLAARTTIALSLL
jgi:hypothetical protein